MDNEHKEKDIKKTISFKLKSLGDLLRLVVSSNQKSAHIFYFEKDGKHIYGTSNVIPAYYDLQGLPIFIWCEHESEPKGAFIYYKPMGEEEWMFKDGIDTQHIHVPVIHLDGAVSILDLDF
ncbi:MAG: hypothetical protein KAR35_01020 [Candidatus Heimdallarchaeota archaeon]|nr:hypothetical protein [Candidatus Heimdallarchaeota archaeon]MCK5047935.1 hypothetical protein [Candidatus Heimdallarchaeota archaeon]